VKVVDFGIAKAAMKTEETQAGTLKGKASYMSPEQCTGSKVDRRSDVFALGIVLYELVTTRRLFKADNDFLTMSAIVAGKVPPAKSHRRDLPDALEAIIEKTLALDPNQRYQSCDAMRAALDDFATQAGLRTSTSALATYLKQQFGERPEPWLVDDDEVEMEMVVDFDGSASALVSPPHESLHELAIPQSVEALQSSPIEKARTKAATGQPATAKTAKTGGTGTGKKPVPAAQVAKPAAAKPAAAKPMKAQIPTAVAPSSEKSSKIRLDQTPVPVALPRKKTITVQIPAANQAAATPPRGLDPRDPANLPLPPGGIRKTPSAGTAPLPGVPPTKDDSQPFRKVSANDSAARKATPVPDDDDLAVPQAEEVSEVQTFVAGTPLADRLRNELRVAICVDGDDALLPDLDAAVAAGRADLVVVDRMPAGARRA
jgi:serine/threonine protein kinase